MNSLVQKMIRVGTMTPMVIYPVQYQRLLEVAGTLDDVTTYGAPGVKNPIAVSTKF